MSELLAAGTERYLVTEVLGKGGMGAVYRAIDLHTGEARALKRLRLSKDRVNDRRLVELFHQEFRTLTRLAHPNVVAVDDYGQDAHGPFYTMELLAGDDLHALAPLPWREASALARDVCSAIALMHSRRMLHRDVSPKNVRRASDGSVKLIDFGAMAPMGVCKLMVGTPPLVPPEAMLQQPLDARADLYAVGGTLYFALTGRYAYAARELGQLSKAWRSPPPPPSAMAPEVPPELDALVLSLLSLDPVARPSSAAEVSDRLSAIAALPRGELPAVSHSYLSTPELVGRSEELARLRTQIGELHAGRGGVLTIEGELGTGRTRMLDTCVLEAKLAGTAVARASAADAGGAPYSVVAALVAQLQELPFARATAGDTEPLALLLQHGAAARADASRRVELQAALQVCLKAAARTQPLLLAIDDIERCDEPSQAALAAAASMCKRERVLFALSLSSEAAARPSAPIAMLRERARTLALSPFSARETTALLASVFGDVPHLHGLAARIHARAEGIARDCMELAQHVVDAGVVRYETAQWVLPPSLPEAALPSTLSLARIAKLEALSADARDIVEALAIAEGSALELDDYLELSEHHDESRLRNALDELLLAQIMTGEGTHYRFEAQIWARELPATMSAARRARLCGRVAEAMERHGSDRLQVAQFFARAGEPSRALDAVLAELGSGSRWDRAPSDYAVLLRSVLAATLELGRSPRQRFIVLQELVKLGLDLELPDLHQHLGELFALLRHDSGLDDLAAIDPALDAEARLTAIFERATARHERTPEAERGLAPLEAIINLMRLEVETSAVAAQTGDHQLFALLPPLDAFFPLSPAIGRLQALSIPACRNVVGARYEQARTLYQEALAALSVKDASVDEDLRVWGMHAIHYALGCIEAGFGREQALRHAEVLEHAPGWRAAAFSVQRIYHLTLGNLRQADRFRRKVELTLLQSPTKPPFSAAAVHQHLFVFALADDLNGMRQAIPELEALAARHRGLAPFIPFARGEHARMCGQYEEALSWQLRAMELVKAGEHPVWPWAVCSYVASLNGLGRHAEARSFVEGELAVARELGLELLGDMIGMHYAIALAKLGDFTSACEELDRHIPTLLAEGAQGVVLGCALEARARIAVWMDDVEGFERHAELCALQFKKSGGEPALASKYERLMQEARARGARLRPELTNALAGQREERNARSTIETQRATAASQAITHVEVEDGERRLARRDS